MNLKALRSAVVHRLLRATGFDIRAEYVDTAPAPQNAIDLFRGEWASRLPGPYQSGEAGLFEDERIAWLNGELGGMQGMQVLECGPLEGGHSYMLERFGADVTAVEAHTRAFLRCLIAKEVLGMRTHFLLGSFVAQLRTRPRYDMIVASGVLYHLPNPVESIALAADATDRLYIWTHYHDPARVSASLRFDEPTRATFAGYEHSLHRQHYQTRLGNPGFFGGAESFSCWLNRQDLLGALQFFGFDRVRIQFDRVDTYPGPSISLLAERTRQSRQH